MELTKIQLTNFKGFRDKSIDAPGGSSINVYADNGVGKTTVADALTWLLFDKDSRGRSSTNFGIKTRKVLEDGSLGEVDHGLEHIVEAQFQDPDIRLKKVYKEKWTRQKGSAERTLTTHTTNHYIDDEPVKKKEYTDRISSIMSEGLFRMLTVPSYFPEQMHWSDRRKILHEMAGEVSREEIIESNPDLDGINEVLDGRTEESQRNILSERRKNLLDEIDNIPSRIDENRRKLKEVDGVDEAPKKIEELQAQKDKLTGELQALKAGGGVAEMEVKIQKIESEKAKFISSFSQESDKEIASARKVVAREIEKLEELQEKHRTAKSHLQQCKDQLNEGKRELESGRSMKGDIESREPKGPPEELSNDLDDCPMCGQPMPEDDKAGKEAQQEYDKYIEEFNESKAEDLKEATDRIKSLEAKVEAFQKNVDTAEKSLESAAEKMEKQEEAVKAAEQERDKIRAESPSPEDQYEYKELEKKQSAIEGKITQIKANRKEAIEAKVAEVAEVDSQIEEQESILQDSKYNQEIHDRVKELQQAIKDNQKKLEKVENDLFLIQEYEVARNSIVTDRVNEKFTHVTWRMYERQINGGVNDQMCEALYKGSSFTQECSNAERIKAGLDIINALSTHYEVSAPVIVDNAEAITRMDRHDLQVIALYVSESDKKIRIEEVD